MPYVQRNEDGKVIAVTDEHQPIIFDEFLEDDHPDVQEFWAQFVIPAPPIEEPPPPDIVEVAAQVNDIDARLSALEDQVAGR